MRLCPTCKKEKKWKEFSGIGSCRECNQKSCSVCGTTFCPTGKKTHCSNRCNLLGNIKINLNNCWEWQKSKTDGYGVIKIGKNKKILAHRLSYQIFRGNFDDSLCVCHHCDNPSCLNPDHLFLGTPQENMKDCEKKLRLFPIRLVSHLRGDKVSHGSKLNIDKVKEIRKFHQQGISAKKISEMFSISYRHAWLVIKKRIWGHIE